MEFFKRLLHGVKWSAQALEAVTKGVEVIVSNFPTGNPFKVPDEVESASGKKGN